MSVAWVRISETRDARRAERKVAMEKTRLGKIIDELVERGKRGEDLCDEDFRRMAEALDEGLEDDGGRLHACVSACQRSYETDADDFAELAEVAYGKLLEWKAETPELDRVTVTTWEPEGDGQELNEMVVMQDGTWRFTYSHFTQMEGREMCVRGARR